MEKKKKILFRSNSVAIRLVAMSEPDVQQRIEQCKNDGSHIILGLFKFT